MNTVKNRFKLIALVALSGLAGLAYAQATAPVAAAKADAAMADGEVRKIDADQGKLTLKHGPIQSLDMPAMTMVFTVKDKALLDKVKTGDKVRFKVVSDAGRLTVTDIALAR